MALNTRGRNLEIIDKWKTLRLSMERIEQHCFPLHYPMMVHAGKKKCINHLPKIQEGFEIFSLDTANNRTQRHDCVVESKLFKSLKDCTAACYKLVE